MQHVQRGSYMISDGLQGPVCQHGAEECLFNRVINCAQHVKPAKDDWLPYVACVEGNLQGDFQKDEAAAKKCAQDRGFDYGAIKECANGAIA
jgi:Gamma interferon inducible lysosomal thiol reductase (GILT)